MRWSRGTTTWRAAGCRGVGVALLECSTPSASPGNCVVLFPSRAYLQILCLMSPPSTPSNDLTSPPPSIQMRLMSPPNATWQQILLQARANPEVLKQPEVSSHIGSISISRSGSTLTEDRDGAALFTTPPHYPLR